MTYSSTFGILLEPLAVDLPQLAIAPVAEYPARSQAYTDSLHQDGHYYPGPTHRVNLIEGPEGTREEPVPNTTRPAHVFALLPSHNLVVNQPAGTDPKAEDANFLVQLLAYLYGTRLQLTGWQFDSRIPVRPPNHHVWRGKTAVQRFLARSYDEWRQLSPANRLRVTNILYLHAKAPAYDWDWEWFLLEYVVTDAIYDFSRRTYLATAATHEERIRELCSRLGVWCPPTAPVDQIVQLRRELFHEGLWVGASPGYAHSHESFERAHELRALNQRLIAAFLAGRTDYTIQPWTEWRQMIEFF